MSGSVDLLFSITVTIWLNMTHSGTSPTSRWLICIGSFGRQTTREHFGVRVIGGSIEPAEIYLDAYIIGERITFSVVHARDLSCKPRSDRGYLRTDEVKMNGDAYERMHFRRRLAAVTCVVTLIRPRLSLT
jgi:hypothetical protein